MIKKYLLRKIDTPKAGIYPIYNDRTVKDSAARCEEDLRNLFRLRTGDISQINLIAPGVGGDGARLLYFQIMGH